MENGVWIENKRERIRRTGGTGSGLGERFQGERLNLTYDVYVLLCTIQYHYGT